jgi:hypothetical protein
MRTSAAVIGLVFPAVANATTRSDFFAVEFENGEAQSVEFVNSVIGWDDFFFSGIRGGSTTIGILEAGTAWFGHEVFSRPPGAPDVLSVWNNPAEGVRNELDYHATMVAHVLAGSGYVSDNGGAYTFIGLGMAPEARVISGGIATEFSTANLGAFNISTESFVGAYRDFFRGDNLGEGVTYLDVINSSWGGSGDPAAVGLESISIDGLAYNNATVSHVVSAGNSGPSIQVGSPANGFNNISVGSTGGAGFLTPSDFSSGGLADFFNPVDNGGTLHLGVRVAVDIAAPGENFYLAAYLGNSGGIGSAFPDVTQELPSTDLYFTSLGTGTSFAAPIVAGGIALLKDAARELLSETPTSNPAFFDTRVMKSVLMAGSTRTIGWDNGQNASNITTQALDPTTGAGLLDLIGSANVYLGQTRGVAGGTGGIVADSGWDMTTINLSQMVVDYVIASPFVDATTLTVALNWFAVRDFDDEEFGQDIAFANLDLQVWSVGSGGELMTMVGESRTLYNNTEFLRLEALDPGQYAMRVLFNSMIYDTTESIDSETFALAWYAVAIPEPGTPLLVLLGGGLLCILRNRKACFAI